MIHLRMPTTQLEIESVQSNNPAMSALSLDLYDLTNSFSLVEDDGTILGTGGVIPVMENTGEAWGSFDPLLFELYPRKATNYIREALDYWQRDRPYGRITLITYAEPKFSDWAISLGFEMEGTLKRFGPGAKDDWCILGRFT